MPKTTVDIAEFRRRIARGHRPGVAVRLAIDDGQAQITADSRTVSFVFSDSSVDRYGDTIDARGWMLDNFNANPVALFGHDSGSVENVIGRAKNVRVEGQRLIGDIEFMEPAVNPNAEAVFQMVKGGFLKTVSVGFQPIEWVAAKDKARPGGIDFKKQELLEISIVPIPANPNALQQAKAAGIDLERLGLATAEAIKIGTRGLYEVGWLASLLADLDFLQDCVAWETNYEGDGSEIPGRLADALKQLGQILMDMTAEEVGEMLAEGEDGVPPIAAEPETAGLSAGQKSLCKLARLAKSAASNSAPRKIKIEVAEQRAGKVLSSANYASLTEAHGNITKGCDTIKGILDAASGATDDADAEGADEAAKAAATAAAAAHAERERRARARKARLRLVS